MLLRSNIETDLLHLQKDISAYSLTNLLHKTLVQPALNQTEMTLDSSQRTVIHANRLVVKYNGNQTLFPPVVK